jgi:hypothetical protein
MELREQLKSVQFSLRKAMGVYVIGMRGKSGSLAITRHRPTHHVMLSEARPWLAAQQFGFSTAGQWPATLLLSDEPVVAYPKD